MQVETVEKNKVKLTFEVSPETFEEGMKYSYNKNKGSIHISGFRKGRVPRKIIELQFGKEMFYDDAINFVLGDAYEAAVKESKLELVSKPEIDVVSASTEDGVVFTAEVYTKPEVTISNYMGVTYSKNDITVTEDEISAEINIAREKNARIISISDRPVADGDIATIDFKGFIDGEAFDGGEGKDYDLTIGGGAFIPGFEEQIIGAALGDDIKVNVSFPDDYHEESLKGKAAVFEVQVKDIKLKEMPEVNDEFAQDVSEFDSLEEYKASISNTIQQSKISEAQNKKENEIMQAIINNAVMDVPQVMIDSQTDQMVNDFTQKIKRQGLPVEMYLQYMGQTMESLRAAYMENAEKQVKGRLTLEAIAKAENIEASDEEVDEELAKMAEMYKMDKEQLSKVISEDDKMSLKQDICVRKALKLVVESAIEMDVMQA